MDFLGYNHAGSIILSASEAMGHLQEHPMNEMSLDEEHLNSQVRWLGVTTQRRTGRYEARIKPKSISMRCAAVALACGVSSSSSELIAPLWLYLQGTSRDLFNSRGGSESLRLGGHDPPRSIL